MAKENNKVGMWVMTEEEYQQKKRMEKRDEMLARLSEAAKQKTIKPKKEPEKSTARSTDSNNESSHDVTAYGQLSDEEWFQLMDRIESGRIDHEISPIEDASDVNILGYWDRVQDDDDKYAKMFKEEIAMASEVLRELKEQGKLVNQRLKAMSGKSAGGGAPKSYSDLISAATTVQSTKLAAIDKIASWKAKREDFRLKAKKEEGASVVSLDDTVDQYYNRILGNRKEYVDTAMNNIEFAGERAGYNNESPLQQDDDDPRLQRFSITDSIMTDDNEIDYDSGDPYGYIGNEQRDVEICVQRLPSGRTAFVALDKNGESVDNYELPGDDLLESMQFRPMSKYANDATGRRYRIIDFDTELDLDDVDNGDYDDINSGDYR